MLLCLRITIDLKDGLIRRAKERAAKEGRTLTSVVEEGLNLVLTAPVAGNRKPVQLPVSRARGGLQAGVELNSGANLEDVMR